MGFWWANFTTVTVTVSGFRLSHLHGGEWHAKSTSFEPVDLEVVAGASGRTFISGGREKLAGGNSNIFVCSPLLAEDFQFD